MYINGVIKMIAINPVSAALYTLSGNEKKNHNKAIERVENIFCPRCKKRIIRIVSERDCLIISKKIGQKKYRKVRCKNFKAWLKDEK